MNSLHLYRLGLTQPRVAATTGLRQSHLTYYYPTRADLRTAVARVPIEAPLAGLRALIKSISSAKLAAAKMAAVAARHENTGVLVALNQAADQEPTVQALFNELLNGFVAELATTPRETAALARSGADRPTARFVGGSVRD